MGGSSGCEISDEVLQLIIDENPNVAMVYVDKEGRIVFINQTYCEVLGIKKEDAIGRVVTEITPHSRLPEVLQTGETHVADLWSIKGRDMIVTRMPIYHNGELVGAMAKSLFWDAFSAKSLINKIMQMRDELAVYKEEVRRFHSARYTFADLVGNSLVMQKVKFIAQKVSRSSSTVLISGETGTGKEVLANAIHNASPRYRQPFIRINCAALPSNLLEAELFGYEEGAFTGAKKGGKPGKFELANRGTIFLDEIGDMPWDMQSKLLTFLQEREFERVGGTRPIKVDVRVICATNVDLEKAVEEGRFRRDLYYRINVVNLVLPPLRERLEDIPALVAYFIQKTNEKLGTKVKNVLPYTLDVLCEYDWPGNVRELENAIERAVHVADMNEEEYLKPEHFSHILRKIRKADPTKQALPLADILAAVERDVIVEALKRNKGNKVAAANELGLHLSVLYRKISKYNIEKEQKGKNHRMLAK